MIFESKLALRIYTLNRPRKLNALDATMLGLLRPQIEVFVFLLKNMAHLKVLRKEWSRSGLCGTIAGTGTGRAFCAGGDVASKFSCCSSYTISN